MKLGAFFSLHVGLYAQYHMTFLADRTNGRAYATVLRLSVVVVTRRRL